MSALALLAGCTTQPLAPVQADGRYCHHSGKSYRPTLTCTPSAVPSAAVQTEVLRFEADPAALTVYVLRAKWADALVVMPVLVDGVATVSTIPQSLVRLRLKPGSHVLSTVWAGQKLETTVAGAAGEQRALELVGSGWTWGTSFRWAEAPVQTLVLRAQALKLVDDLDLRR